MGSVGPLNLPSGGFTKLHYLSDRKVSVRTDFSTFLYLPSKEMPVAKGTPLGRTWVILLNQSYRSAINPEVCPGNERGLFGSKKRYYESHFLNFSRTL